MTDEGPPHLQGASLSEAASPTSADAQQFSRVVIAFYAAMAVVGHLLAWLTDSEIRWTNGAAAAGIDVAVGAGVGLAIVGATAFGERRFEWARRLSQRLASSLPTLSRGHVAISAVASGIGEEVLFRGALQPHLGLIVTSLLFGVIHGGVTGPLRTWALFATVAGFTLGALAAARGGILAPVVAHMVVNGINLAKLTGPTRP
ncbi:MAG: CPBP family intramembrane metalloprotease [Myxococcales bacterium]|nr:CPBP family intramembrane metalloprotease [Myxococcales bacterium]